MTDRHTLRLTKANFDRAIQGVVAAVAKGGWTLELRKRTRTDDQNDGLHGLIAQIMKQRPVLHGARMTKEKYKAVFMQALGQEVTMLPMLEGNGFFPMGLSTSRLTVAEFSDLMEVIFAWCAREGITVKHFDGDEGAVGAKDPVRAAA